MRLGHKICIVVIVFYLLIAAGGLCAADDIRFERVPILQGSMRSMVNDIAQDPDGFLWFATRRGLCRYDGYLFIRYRHNPADAASISSNVVTDILAVDGHYLWLVTDAGGIERFNLKTHTFQHFQLFDSRGPVAEESSAAEMVIDDSGDTLVRASGGALYRLNIKANQFQSVDIRLGGESKRIEWLFATPSGKAALLILEEGFHVFDRETDSLKPLNRSEASNLFDSYWGDVAEQDSWRKRMWLKSLVSLPLFNTPDRNSVVDIVRKLEGAFPTGKTTLVNAAALDSLGRLWVGTDTAGVYIFDPVTDEITTYTSDPDDHSSTSSDEILSLYADTANSMWVGTAEGLNKYGRYRYKFRTMQLHRRDGKPLTDIFAVLEDSHGDLWVSTMLDGLYLFPGAKSGQAGRLMLGGVVVLSMLEDSKRDIYIGTTNKGLMRYVRSASRFEAVAQAYQITDILEDHSGKLWMASISSGLGEVNRQTGDVAYWKPRSPSEVEEWTFDARVVCEDSKGNFWIGFDGGGVVKLLPDRTTYVRFRHDPDNLDTLSSNQIYSIREDKSGSIWVATPRGLNHINPESGEVTRYYEGEILPDNVVCSIQDDDEGNLWFGTFSGLVKFNPQTDEVFSYDINDGIQDYEYLPTVSAKGKNGRLYFGGVSGVDRFIPSELNSNPSAPKVVITKFKVHVNGEWHYIDPFAENPLVITPDVDDIYAEYSAIDFNDPRRNRFLHNLEGYDSEWVNSGIARFARYTCPPPGDYIFRVKAANNDGVWNEEGISIPIKILPSIWVTWQFRAFVGLLAVGVVAAGFRIRINAIEKQRSKLLKEVEERKIAELKLLSHQTRLRLLASELTLSEERQRRRIATSLHDDIGHALLGTKVKLSALGQELGDEKHKENITSVLETIQKTLQQTRSLTSELSPPSLYQFGFESAAENLVESFGKEYGIKTIFTRVQSGFISEQTAILLYQSLRELLINILKHAQAQTITVIIDVKDGFVSVTIRDDGVGFDTSEFTDADVGAKGYGLFSVRERLESVGGKFYIESTPGKGTEVNLLAPLSGASEE